MDKKEISVTFHDLLNEVTSIRNAIYLVLLEKKQPAKEAKEYLKESLELCQKLITGLQNLRQRLEKEENRN